MQPGLTDKIIFVFGITVFSEGKVTTADSVLYPDLTWQEHVEQLLVH
jgi:hypothetical protein